jgi:hypothetical protein
MAELPRPVASLRYPPIAGAEARFDTPPAVVRRLTVIPERYSTREKDGVRTLECDEAPRIRVVIDPGIAFSRSDASSLGERVILLDGAGTFGPLVDSDRKLFNLDHHTGCERLFTLATCEQALLLVHSGLRLSEDDWTIYANDPDLDTVLGLWCLLNHRRLRELRPEARDVLLPIVRLEGAIDANGPELARLCGLPTRALADAQRRIEELLVRERELRQAGAWAKKDAYAHTIEMLRSIDALVYQFEDFGDYTRIEEIYGHVEIGPRQVAVVCRDRSGIYTVEQHLKTHWGDQLSLIALENQPGHYTLRRVSSLDGPDLEPAYELLNRIDPAVDGRPPGKRWGGSADIGGSPRPRGTQLASAEVIEILERAYRKPGLAARTARTAIAFAVGLAFLAFWPLASALPAPDLSNVHASFRAAYELGVVALLALAVGTVATRGASRWRPWVFGWRMPAPGRWWTLAPALIACAIPLRGWIPARVGATPAEFAAGAAAAVLMITAVELWFRGLVHGLLSLDFKIQHPGGPRFFSRAAVGSAFAYAAVATIVTARALAATHALEDVAEFGIGASWVLGFVAAAALCAGLVLGSVRERSLSIAAGLSLQMLGAATATAAWLWLQ